MNPTAKPVPARSDGMRLHFREMLEPAGLWGQKIVHNIKPAHKAL